MIEFVTNNLGLIAAVSVALFDLMFALKPEWKSNGLLHWVYTVSVAKKK